LGWLKKRVSKTRVQTLEGSRRQEAKTCEICGWDRFVELAHIVPACKGGTYEKINILFLCPNHHRLFDGDELTVEEWNKIKGRVKKACDYFKIMDRNFRGVHLHEV